MNMKCYAFVKDLFRFGNYSEAKMPNPGGGTGLPDIPAQRPYLAGILGRTKIRAEPDCLLQSGYKQADAVVNNLSKTGGFYGL